MKSTITRSPLAARPVDVLVTGALLAQHVERVVDVVRADRGDRALDDDVGKIADPHVRVHLEHRREFELVRRCGVLARLDARIAGDAQVLRRGSRR